MSTNRIVKLTLTPKPTLEGAGVRLKRGFGFGQEHAFDPFLLFDDFSGNCPADYQAGFPWHPHRGIETITYLLEGNVDHGDSLGNAGSIQAGDVQWMTAGSGIIHQEMPHGNPEGRMSGFQLWANLPASQKMMAPRYQGLESRDIPLIEKPGLTLRVIGGKVDGVRGPARDIVIQPEYLDIKLNALAEWQHPTPPGHTVFAYLFQGSAKVEENSPDLQGENGLIVLLTDGDSVSIKAGQNGARLLLISGKPVREPIAWGGPIVMNTQEELQTAFAEYRAGTFIKN